MSEPTGNKKQISQILRDTMTKNGAATFNSDTTPSSCSSDSVYDLYQPSMNWRSSEYRSQKGNWSEADGTGGCSKYFSTGATYFYRRRRPAPQPITNWRATPPTIPNWRLRPEITEESPVNAQDNQTKTTYRYPKPAEGPKKGKIITDSQGFILIGKKRKTIPAAQAGETVGDGVAAAHRNQFSILDSE